MGLPAVSVSDIIKLLEKVPEWMGLKRLLARIDELERRVAALEGARARPAVDLVPCPRCGAHMDLVTSRPDPKFGFAGAKLDDRKCSSCGFEEQVMRKPV